MPTIPSLERRTVTPQTRISSVDTGGAASLGRVVAAGVKDILDTRDRYQLADAASKFSIMKHKQDSAYDEDMDYETIESRWDASMNDGLDEILQGISNPEARNFFAMESRTKIAAGKEKINNIAFSKERDVKRSEINTHLNGLREVVLGGDPEASRQAIADAEGLYAASVAKGYHGAEEAGNTIKAWKVDAAEAYVFTQDPKSQLEALHAPYVKDNIPSDRWKAIERNVKGNVTRQTASDMVDELGSDFSPDDLYEAANSIKDIELRAQVESRGEEVLGNRKAAKAFNDEKFFQETYLPVAMGDQELDVKSKEFLSASPQMQTNLLAAEAAKNAPPKHTSYDIVSTMNEKIRDKDWSGVRELLLTQRKFIDPVDFDKWSKISNEGDIPEEYKMAITLDQLILGKLNGEGITSNKEKYLVHDKVNRWRRKEIESGRGEPSDAAIEDFIDGKLKKVQLDPGYFSIWTEEKAFYELTPEDRKRLTANTLEEAKNAPDMQLNVVLNEVLDDTVDAKTLAKALRVGAEQSQVMSDDGESRIKPVMQAKIAARIANREPDVYQKILEEYQAAVLQTKDIFVQSMPPRAFLKEYLNAKQDK